MRKTSAIGLAMCACAVASGCGAEHDTVRIEGPTGEVRGEFQIVVARTANERARGLVGSEPLRADEGMLFVFPVADEVCVTNAGVTFAIDVVFIGERGEVLAVEAGLPADSSAVVCHPSVQFLLEVAAGAAASVHTGDVVQGLPSPL